MSEFSVMHVMSLPLKTSHLGRKPLLPPVRVFHPVDESKLSPLPPEPFVLTSDGLLSMMNHSYYLNRRVRGDIKIELRYISSINPAEFGVWLDSVSVRDLFSMDHHTLAEKVSHNLDHSLFPDKEDVRGGLLSLEHISEEHRFVLKLAWTRSFDWDMDSLDSIGNAIKELFRSLGFYRIENIPANIGRISFAVSEYSTPANVLLLLPQER